MTKLLIKCLRPAATFNKNAINQVLFFGDANTTHKNPPEGVFYYENEVLFTSKSCRV